MSDKTNIAILWGKLRQRLDAIYERRRLARPQEGNRSFFTVAPLCLALLALFWFFVAITNVNMDFGKYLQHRPRVLPLSESQLFWQVQAWKPSDSGRLESSNEALHESDTRVWHSLESFDDLPKPSERTRIFLRTRLTRERLQDLNDYLTVVFSLPGLKYYRADVWVNRRWNRRFFLSRRIEAVLEPQLSAEKYFQIDLLLTAAPGQRSYWEKPMYNEPVFLSTQAEYEQFLNYQAIRLAGKGSWLTVVTKIVLAFFVICLFLIIDESPESLGLAFAMGFEASAVVLENGWLKVSLLGQRADLAVSEGLHQLGAVFFLYFICQLGRLSPKRLRPWMIAGLTAAVALGTLRYIDAVHVTGRELPWFSYWTFALKILPLGVCFIALARVAALRLPWRLAALCVATFACVLDATAAGMVLSKSLQQTSLFLFLVDIVHPGTAFLFVLSIFFNISTMEQRIRSQAKALASAREIEHELEIGKQMQQSLHRVPRLPDAVAFSYFYQPKSYVSGDTFFVAADDSEESVSVLLTDITGHGIQAALIASACSAIAMTVWNHNDLDAVRQVSKVKQYHERLKEYLKAHSTEDEFAAVSALELNYQTGRLHCFRANYLSPIIIEPRTPEHGPLAAEPLPRVAPPKKLHAGEEKAEVPAGHTAARPEDAVFRGRARATDSWSVRVMALPNEVEVCDQVRPGSYLLIVSDGVCASSADMMEIIRYLRSRLNSGDRQLNVEYLRTLMMAMPGLAGLKDDKTFLILHWKNPTSITSVLPANASGFEAS